MKFHSTHRCLLPLFATLFLLSLRSDAASSIVDGLEAYDNGPEGDKRSEEVKDAYALAGRGLNDLAFEKLKKAAGKGDVDAFMALGVMHLEGIGTEKNLKLAKENFAEAAAKGSRSAREELVLLKFRFPESAEEFEEARKQLEQLALDGVGFAQFRLGQAYLGGYGFPADAEKAIDFLERATKSEGPFKHEAEFVLGQLYRGGNAKPEVKPDSALAMKWLNAAAEADHTGAIRALGELFAGQDEDVRDYGRAKLLFSRLEELGDPSGSYLLGEMSENGMGGEKDLESALESYRKAAEKDVPEALFKLGTFHQEGLGGLEKSKETAIEYYRRGAKLGHGISMFNLSVLIDKEEKSKDLADEVIGLLFGAAASGLVEAEYKIGTSYLNGNGVQKDFVAAAAWFDRAARAGHAHSQLTLGEMYENGQGVNRNLGAARNLYELSAKGGDLAGSIRYAGSLADGMGGEKDLPEAYVYATVASEAIPAENPLSELAIKLRENIEEAMTPDQMAEAKKRLSAVEKASPGKE